MKVRNNPLEIRVTDMRIPRKVTDREYIEGLIDAALSQSKELPEGWKQPLIYWRNPETKHGRTSDWQEPGEFTEVLTASRSGFSTSVANILRQHLADVDRERIPKAKKKRSGFLKRSLAAKKGWHTRWLKGKAVGRKGQAFLNRQGKAKPKRKAAKKRQATKTRRKRS